MKQTDPIGSPPRPASQSSIGQLNHSMETRPASDGSNWKFSALLSAPPTLHSYPLGWCTDTHTHTKRNILSQTLSVRTFSVFTALKIKKIKSPRSAGGVSFFGSSPDLWLGQFLKARCCRRHRSFLPAHHATQLGIFWELLLNSEPRSRGDSGETT